MIKPPKFALKLLLLFLKRDLEEEVVGDLEEKFYSSLSKRALWRAKLNYWFQVLNYFRPFAIKNTKSRLMNTRFGSLLISNYIMIAFRIFKKDKQFTLINALGLSLGICSSLFIYLWAQDELKFNAEFDENVVRVLHREVQTGGGVIVDPYVSYPLKDVLEENYPSVEKAIVMSRGNWSAFEVNEELIEFGGIDASPEIFEFFNMKMIKGDYQKMYDNMNTIVISRSFAETYFGKDWESQDLIGTILENDIGDSFELIGFYEDFSYHTTLEYKFVVPFDHLLNQRPGLKRWGISMLQVYIKTADGVSIEDARKLLVNADVDHRKDYSTVKHELILQPIKDAYLYGRFKDGNIDGGRIDYVRLLLAGAIFILVLACINFMNLSTARSVQRAKEIGIRKVMGALKMDLRNQFLIESILITFFSVLLAIGVVLLFLDSFNRLTMKDIEYHVFTLKSVGYLIVFGLVLGILSGLYPAYVLSSINTQQSLKGLVAKGRSRFSFRKFLVVLQFAITVIMITGAVTVFKQVSYIQNKNIGLDRTNLVRTYTYDMDQNKEYASFKNELLKRPGVESVTIVDQLLINMRNTTDRIKWEGKEKGGDINFYVIDANPDFLPTVRIELKEGRNFSWDLKTDTMHYLVNEAAVNAMGLTDPIGKSFKMWGQEGKIIGVVKDFHLKSLHNSIEPLVIRNDMAYNWMVLLRTKEGMQKEAVESLEEVFYLFNNPKRAFYFRFMDDMYENQYRSEMLIKDLLWFFTIIAIGISLIGLFSLVAYSTSRRTKEVGIRKVLGATISDILRLLSREYTILLGLGLLIAVPLSHQIMTYWLSGFAYRIELGVGVYIAASSSALLMGYLVVLFKTAKTATLNPVNQLRDE
ncbi:ABC transporter permease [Ekhidna sp.]